MGFLSGMLGTNNDFNAADPSIISHQNLAKDYDQAKFEQVRALRNQEALLGALQGQNGLQNQNAVFGQQQNLANQLQQQAMGAGPNPAQQMLANATGANTANQAALMAGQRGSSSNAGLIARQAANVGANNQQQMAGQGALMQAQQQLAAQQQLMQQQALMGSMANQQVSNQMQGVGAYTNAANMYGQNVSQNIGQSMQATAGMNQINSQTAQGNQAMKGQLVGGALKGIGTAAGVPMAHGGQVPCYEAGGVVGPQSLLGKHLSGMNMKAGGQVPGQASVKGDSLKNDVVPAMLSPKEIVLPRSITMSPDAPDKAKAFVQALLAKKGM